MKKYPAKVARKRAKQILINEALENTTPEITANVRTIPGIITMRGCTYAGCKGVIMARPGTSSTWCTARSGAASTPG